MCCDIVKINYIDIAAPKWASWCFIQQCWRRSALMRNGGSSSSRCRAYDYCIDSTWYVYLLHFWHKLCDIVVVFFLLKYKCFQVFQQLWLVDSSWCHNVLLLVYLYFASLCLYLSLFISVFDGIVLVLFDYNFLALLFYLCVFAFGISVFVFFIVFLCIWWNHYGAVWLQFPHPSRVF